MLKIRKLILSVLSMLLGFLVALALLEVTFQFFPVNTGLQVQEVNAENPIQHFKVDRDYIFSRDWDFSIVNKGHVNNIGFVSDWDYNSNETSPLLAVIGDSFIEALMVPFTDTVQGRLGNSVGTNGRVYSFAASGSSLSQYLIYADYAKKAFSPDAMVINVVGNDFDESLLKYKSDPAFHYFSEKESGELVLSLVDYQPSKVRKLLRYSALIRYLATNLYAFERLQTLLMGNRETRAQEYVGNVVAIADAARLADSKRAVDTFLEHLPEYSGLPVERIILLVDGMRPSLYTIEGRKDVKGSYFDLMRQYFINNARKSGYYVDDLQDRFVARYEKDGSHFEFENDGHWNRKGHEEAARAVMEWPVFQKLFKISYEK